MNLSIKALTRALLLACACGSLGACATITRGTDDTLVIETDPSGAKVKTTNGFTCEQTPCSFKMPRKSEIDVTISKAGYKTWKGHVGNKVSGGGGAAMAGNVLVGGIIGAVVDGSNGSMLDLTPNPLKVSLEKDDGSPPPPAAPQAQTPPPAAPPVPAPPAEPAPAPKAGE